MRQHRGECNGAVLERRSLAGLTDLTLPSNGQCKFTGLAPFCELMCHAQFFPQALTTRVSHEIMVRPDVSTLHCRRHTELPSCVQAAAPELETRGPFGFIVVYIGPWFAKGGASAIFGFPITSFHLRNCHWGYRKASRLPLSCPRGV